MTVRMYVWQGVAHLTGNYHDGGGVAVVAKDLPEARVRLRMHLERYESTARFASDATDELCTALVKDPDYDIEVHQAEYEPKVIVFPDAGCC